MLQLAVFEIHSKSLILPILQHCKINFCLNLIFASKLTIFIEKFVSQTFWVTFEMKSKQANTVSKKRDVGRRMKWGIELLFPPAGRSSLNSLFEMRWWQKLRRKLKLSLAKETVNNWAFLLAQFGKGDHQSIANSGNASSSLISTNCAKRISLLLW